MHTKKKITTSFQRFDPPARAHHWPPRSLKEPQHPEKPVARKWRTHAWSAGAAVLWVFVMGLLQTLSTAYAQTPDDVTAGSLLFVSEQGATAAPRVHTDVSMQISGLIARVEVAQQFTNPGDQWVEGVYAFPLPENAAVTQLHMNVGERVIVGEIREKVEAQRLFEQARANGQRASVVHQQRPNIFRTSVANIGPGQSIAIKITYLQIVDHERGRYSLRFPLTITPRYLPGVAKQDLMLATAETPVRELTAAVDPSDPARLADLHPALMNADASRQSVRFDIDLDAGLAVENVASAHHRIDVLAEGRRRRIRLADDSVAPDRDFELSWTPLVQSEAAAVLFREHTDDGEHVLLMFMPPRIAAPLQTPRDVIFIIDTSGSMAGESIEQAREALLHGLSTLNGADRFNIIQFNSVHETLFDEPVEASEHNISRARRYVRSLESDGGTEMLPALTEALAMPSAPGYLRQVVFITDGAVGNEDQLMAVIHARLGAARLFTVGIGSAPNGHFMRKAAQMGRGTFTFIGSTNEVDRRMSALLNKLAQPVLTDITLTWPEGVRPEYAPAHIGDLYADEPILVTARLKAPTQGVLEVFGKTDRAWGRQIALDQAEARAGVATLWARRKIEALMDGQVLGQSEDAIRSAVLPLALQYQLVSKYTSLVAVDKTPVRPDAEPLRSNRIENTKPHGSEWPASGPSTATNAQLMLIAGLACLFFAVLLLARRPRARRMSCA